MHLSIELEVLASLRENPENEIISMTCDATLPGCFFNPTKNVLACALCESRTQNYRKLIGKIDKEPLTGNKSSDEKCPEIKSLNELENFTYKDINIGRGIASSLISITRDFDVHHAKHRKKLEALFNIAVVAFESLSKAITKHRPEVIYFFNGRFTETHVLKELCIKKGIDFFTFEVATKGKYLVFENALPHSMKLRKKLIHDMWTSTEESKRLTTAREFYEKKRIGTFKARFNHTKKQERDNLPEDWDASKKNIVFFNSSEDEMKTIEDWKQDIFSSQNEAIQTIVTQYTEKTNIQFHLRVHPNLGQVENSQIKEIENFNYNNLKVIGPNEKTDSYALVSQADIVICFGSTIGIESTYWGTPSIMFGRSFYEDLDATYTPSSYDELYELIDNKALQPKPQENTLPYGYYVSSFGTPFKYVKYNGKTETFFNDVRIKKWHLNLIPYIVRYSKNISTWKSLTRTFTNKSLKPRHITKLLNQIPK